MFFFKKKSRQTIKHSNDNKANNTKEEVNRAKTVQEKKDINKHIMGSIICSLSKTNNGEFLDYIYEKCNTIEVEYNIFNTPTRLTDYRFTGNFKGSPSTFRRRYISPSTDGYNATYDMVNSSAIRNAHLRASGVPPTSASFSKNAYRSVLGPTGSPAQNLANRYARGY